ncbi:hypothetical protein ACIBK9_27570 [Nonomuraea sp. NPDC050227]|uniref:hypothetical protein n=1 Tax=Nonomuraea sp. NPDC050227 TaxID=3364360 RepID=UPI0037950057
MEPAPGAMALLCAGRPEFAADFRAHEFMPFGPEVRSIDSGWCRILERSSPGSVSDAAGDNARRMRIAILRTSPECKWPGRAEWAYEEARGIPGPPLIGGAA